MLSLGTCGGCFSSFDEERRGEEFRTVVILGLFCGGGGSWSWGGVEWKVGQTKGGKILILLHLGTSERWERVSGIHTHDRYTTTAGQPAGGGGAGYIGT